MPAVESRHMSCLRASAVCVLLLCGAANAGAQDPVIEPIPVPKMTPFVADVRGTWARLKQDVTVASDLSVEGTDLPSRGLGFVVGAHVYPLRTQKFALGLGGELLRVRGSNTVKIEPADPEGEPTDGPTLKTQWTQWSPQVSLNFGHRDGWSYLTAGMGQARFDIERTEPDAPAGPTGPVADDAGRKKTRVLNYGGGARWFMKKHLAFTLDLRFYSINAQEAAGGLVATPKMRVMVFSGGVSIR